MGLFNRPRPHAGIRFFYIVARQPEPRCITPPEGWSSRGLFLGITRRVLDYQKGLLGFRQAVVDPALSLEGLALLTLAETREFRSGDV